MNNHNLHFSRSRFPMADISKPSKIIISIKNYKVTCLIHVAKITRHNLLSKKQILPVQKVVNTLPLIMNNVNKDVRSWYIRTRSFKFKNIFLSRVQTDYPFFSNLDWSLNNQFSFCQPLFSIVSIKQQTLKNFIFTQILFPIRNTILK